MLYFLEFVFTLSVYGGTLLRCNCSLRCDLTKEGLSKEKGHHDLKILSLIILVSEIFAIFQRLKASRILSSPSRYDGRISIHAIALKGGRSSASINSFQLSVQGAWTWMWTLWKFQRGGQDVGRNICLADGLFWSGLSWEDLRLLQVCKHLKFGNTRRF